MTKVYWNSTLEKLSIFFICFPTSVSFALLLSTEQRPAQSLGILAIMPRHSVYAYVFMCQRRANLLLLVDWLIRRHSTRRQHERTCKLRLTGFGSQMNWKLIDPLLTLLVFRNSWLRIRLWMIKIHHFEIIHSLNTTIFKKLIWHDLNKARF